MKKILICEDEKDVIELLNNLLIKAGFEVYIAIDGKETIDKTKKIKPDLLLLDIRMPKINGLEAAKMIRDFNREVKIIFLTGFQSQELLKEAAKYDIFDYIVKTSSTKEILKVIQEAAK
ncbi:MAG: response regulator [Actinomycetota bacterium]